MNRSSQLIALIVILMASLLLTGFQCGSSEMTSGKLYRSQKNYEKADTALTKELAKNPDNAEAWYLLGMVSIERSDVKDFKKMNECFTKSLASTEGAKFEPDISIARTFAWQTSMRDGIQSYNRSVALMQDQASTAKDSIPIYRQKAIEQYKLAIVIIPDSIAAHQNLAIAEQVSGNYDGAIAAYKEVLKRKPSTDVQVSIINAYISKAQDAEQKNDVATSRENYENALAGLNEARKADPENPELLQSMIAIYMKTGRASEAVPALREMIAKDPSNKVYQYNLGVLLMQGNNLVEAISHFDAALQIDPSYDVALQNIAAAHVKIADRMKDSAGGGDSKKKLDKSYVEHFKKAAEYLERLVDLKKDNPDYLEYLATAYANAGMLKKAEEAMKKADALRKK